jgi:hypothetical protein
MALPTPTPREEITILFELLDGSSALFSAPALQQREGTYGLNREVYTTYAVDGQAVKGSGQIVIGEHTFFVLIEQVNLADVRGSILAALATCDGIRLGERTQPAMGLRISSEEPRGEAAWAVGITVAPLTHESTGGSGDGPTVGL